MALAGSIQMVTDSLAALRVMPDTKLASQITTFRRLYSNMDRNSLIRLLARCNIQGLSMLQQGDSVIKTHSGQPEIIRPAWDAANRNDGNLEPDPGPLSHP